MSNWHERNFPCVCTICISIKINWWKKDSGLMEEYVNWRFASMVKTKSHVGRKVSCISTKLSLLGMLSMYWDVVHTFISFKILDTLISQLFFSLVISCMSETVVLTPLEKWFSTPYPCCQSFVQLSPRCEVCKINKKMIYQWKHSSSLGRSAVY